MESLHLFFQDPLKYETALITGIFTVFVIFVCAILCYKCAKESNFILGDIVMFFLMTGYICCIWFGICKTEVTTITKLEIMQEELSTKQEQLTHAVESNYDIYINGIEVEEENINVYSFSNVTINDENKTILITVD